MNYQQIIEEIKPELEKIVDFLKEELLKIRTSRLSATLIEDIEVDCLGTLLPLKQLAAISSSGPKQLLIQPWDRSYLEPILRALDRSEIDLSPILDKETIRLSAPPLTGERREDLLRIVAKKTENTHQALRRARDKAWRNIQQGYQKGEIREDDKYKGKDKLEEIVGEYKKKIEEMSERKKKEITQ